MPDKKPRISILMTRHYLDLGSASDWSCRVGNFLQPIKSTTQIWVVARHQYGISALVSQTSFVGKSVVASRNIGWFLRPGELKSININFIKILESNKILHDRFINSIRYRHDLTFLLITNISKRLFHFSIHVHPCHLLQQTTGNSFHA